MVTCPSGHSSADPDFCTVCGDEITGGPPAESAPAAVSPPSPSPPADGGGSGESCPRCGTPRTGRFCEEDGYDFVLGAGRSGPAETLTFSAPPVPSTPPAEVPAPAPAPAAAPAPSASKAGWTALVVADHAYYEKVMAEVGPDSGIVFPPYCPERLIELSGTQIRIGRRSVTHNVTPEIDLSGPPEDAAVSHMHAVLLLRPDGAWSLVDPGSTNGTTVNGSTDPIPVNAEFVVGDGDRIHVGAWTTIQLRKGQS